MIESDKASRRWRAIWRTHFYAGLVSAPFLVLMSLTGLVILYSQPIRNATQGELRTVSASGSWVPFETQKAAVTAAFPDTKITTMITPAGATSATVFGLDGGRQAFVNPYSGALLGSSKTGNDLVGLANRFHNALNNEAIKVPLPAMSALFGDGAAIQSFVLGDMLLEILAGWGLVLAASGVYLWWPRRTRETGERVGKAIVVPRLAKRGRARWRDLHAIPGFVLSLGLVFVLVSGLPWSAYWGKSFTAAANKISPNVWVDAPNSGVAKLGDLDRLGNQINWNTGNAALPNSTATVNAAPVNLDTIAAVATQEGMLPGYSIAFPIDGKDDVGNATYGSFTLSNSWPRKTHESKTAYLDQFSGRTISTMSVNGYGSVSRASDTLVSTHMGTQFGVITRVIMTLVCLLTLWSVISASVMFLKRRRPGAVGLPRRPRELKMANRLIAITMVLGIIYPLWGASALLVLAFDRFVVRRTPKLRIALGQR